MRSQASGPLGALFVLAPLAAVPILAIVGVPQFAPVVASPADDEPSLGFAEVPQTSDPSSRPTHSAHDLFAPVESDASPHQGGVSDIFQQGTRNRGTEDYGNTARQKTPADWDSAGAPLRPQGSYRQVEPPPEALDGWEVVTEVGQELEQERVPQAGRNHRPDAREDSQEFASIAQDAAQDAFEPSKRGDSRQDNFARNSHFDQDPRRIPEDVVHEQPEVEQETAADSFGFDERAAAQETPDASTVELLEEPLTWQAAAKRLKQVGVKRYRLQSLPDEEGFLFSCSVVHPDNPRVAHRFEADADEPLLAVHKVLEQIQDWQAQR